MAANCAINISMAKAKSQSRLQSLQGIKRNERQQMDALELLGKLPDRIASVVVCDPQYRTGLEQLNFGNEGVRQQERAKLPQMTDETITAIVRETERILKPSSYLFLWVDKFSIGSGQHLKYLAPVARYMRVVDLIVWNKMDIGMGRRARCVTEFLVIIQKEPVRAKDTWTDHRIADCWHEGRNPDRHPHAKPHVLMERLIRAVTMKGDLIVDPCAGGYGVLEAAQLSQREFIGGDLL